MELLSKIKRGCKNAARSSVKLKVGKKKCYNCGGEFKMPEERNFFIEFILFSTTWWMLWIPLIIYYIVIPKYRCPLCKVRLSDRLGNYRKEQIKSVMKEVEEEKSK